MLKELARMTSHLSLSCEIGYTEEMRHGGRHLWQASQRAQDDFQESVDSVR